MLYRSKGRALEGRQILLLEDDYSQAQDAVSALQNAGASVIGPFANQASAAESLAAMRVNGAILDIYTDGAVGFTLARTLQRQGVPFLFMTCLNRTVVPEDLCRAPLLGKPIDLGLLVVATRDLVRNRHMH